MVDTEQLKAFKIFKDLSERELELIANFAKEEKVKAGWRIFQEKAFAINMYLILEGKVEIEISGNGGEKTVIDQAGAGEIFGWSAVTEPYNLTAAAYALEATQLIALKGTTLMELFDKNNYIGYRVMLAIAVVISRRLKAMASKFVETLRMKK